MDIIDRLIAREGGAKVVTDPFGGLTKFGISQRAYPGLDIANLTYDQARSIYANDYLLKTNISRIGDSAVQEMVFDYAVLSGPSAAIKTLQKLTGQTVDGRLGPLTLAATASTDPTRLVSALGRERISYYVRQCQSAPSKLTYLNGWIMRVLSLYT